MINSLEIKNYKSIKKLKINPKRINLFIGEHNSGKSNILEALSWLSVNATGKDVFNELFRFKNATDFFYDFNVDNPIEITTNETSAFISNKELYEGLLNHFVIYIYNSIDVNKYPDIQKRIKFLNESTDSGFSRLNLQYDGSIIDQKIYRNLSTNFRAYTYKRLKQFYNHYLPYLNPPFGDNIPSLLLSSKKYKDIVSSIFREKGFRLMMKPTENDITMAKDVNDELYAYNYQSISETLQRIVFYQLAIESNKGATLILDEPESNTFPMYTKQLGELIALDNSNQYFIVTHDPYLLGSIVSKTPINELAVYVTNMEDYQTKVQLISDTELSNLLDKGTDIFFNLEKLSNK